MKNLSVTNIISISIALISLIVTASVWISSEVSTLNQRQAVDAANIQILFKSVSDLKDQINANGQAQLQATNRLEDQMNNGFTQLRDQIREMLLVEPSKQRGERISTL